MTYGVENVRVLIACSAKNENTSVRGFYVIRHAK